MLDGENDGERAKSEVGKCRYLVDGDVVKLRDFRFSTLQRDISYKPTDVPSTITKRNWPIQSNIQLLLYNTLVIVSHYTEPTLLQASPDQFYVGYPSSHNKSVDLDMPPTLSYILHNPSASRAAGCAEACRLGGIPGDTQKGCVSKDVV